MLVHYLIILIWVLVLSYSLFTLALLYYWCKTTPSPTAQEDESLTISVIIPVRNEVNNIQDILNDLAKQTFPSNRFEVIVADDASTDGTRELVKQLITVMPYKISIAELPDAPTTSPKKRAIETAIKSATGKLIITTDGDCRAGAGWLRAFADHYVATGSKLISGPVTFTAESTLTDHLQTVEFASLIGSGASAITAGYPSLCNGANLAYEKAAFYEVNGYDGVRHIASGDDEFLMHKIALSNPGHVSFLKNPDAVVRTRAHKNWGLFFSQRKRWASKWKHYQSKTPLVMALYVFGCNFALISSFVCFALGYISSMELGVICLLKYAPEWLFLGSVLRFLNKGKSTFFIPLTQIIYPFYVCFFGLAVQNPVYEWKGRKLV